MLRLTKELMEDLTNRPQCPECDSHFVVKDGKQWGKQTYLCKKCFRRFTPNAKHKFRPRHIKEQAIRLFVHGNSINSIAKALDIPFPTVQKWIKKAGQKAERKFLRKLLTLKKEEKVKAISINEVWSFAGKKENEVWIWSVIVEYEKARTEKYLFTGDRSMETFLKDSGKLASSTDL